MAEKSLALGKLDHPNSDAESRHSRWEAPIPSPNRSKAKHELKVPRCPLWQLGCNFRGDPDDFNFHLNGLPIYHMSLLTKCFKECQDIADELLPYIDSIIAQYETVLRRSAILRVDYGISNHMWVIDNYNYQKQAAKFGVKRIIFSKPFYTGTPGYKMVLSTALYGDGDAFGEYMSVFVSLAKGDWDGLMPWPFSHTVHITLMDQSGDMLNRHNITFTLSPTIMQNAEPFFGRPQAERNPSFGAKRFAHLAALDELSCISNDSIILRVQIE